MKHKFLILLLLVFTCLGCENPLEYKYQDKPQLVDCPSENSALMHEALYSFQEDIGAYYSQFSDYRPGTKSYYMEAYFRYVFFGFSGAAPFHEIASNHSLRILEELKEIPGLFIEKEGRWEVNYEHEFVSCLLSSVQDDDLRTQMSSMRKVNIFGPREIAEVMRVNVVKIIQDPYLAMYMSLDAYYQYMADLDLKPKD